MKISQLDFSAIQAANQNLAASKQHELAVETMEHNNKLIQWNTEFTDKYIKAVRKAEDVANWMQGITTMVNAGIDLYQNIVAQKKQQDTQTANDALISASDELRDFTLQDINTNQAGYFDSSGQPQLSEGYIAKRDELRTRIEALDISDDIKAEALTKWDQMGSDAEYTVMSGLWETTNSNLASGREWQVNEAMDADIANAMDTFRNGGGIDYSAPTVNGAIGSFGLDAGSTANAQRSYSDDFRVKLNNQLVAETAKTGGYAAGKDLISSLDTKNAEERDALDDLAYSTAQKQTKKDVQAYTEEVTNRLANGESPRLVMDSVEASLDGMKDEGRKEQILSAVDQAVYSNGLRALGLDSGTDISGMQGEDLNNLRKNFEEQRDMLFPGERLSGDADALGALIAGEYDKIASSNAKANIAHIKNTMAAVSAGTMSPADAILEISHSYSVDSDGSDETEALNSIGKLYDMYIPDQWKTYNKQRLSAFEDIYAAAMGLDEKDPEQLMRIKNAGIRANQYAIGVFSKMPGEEINEEVIDGVWDQAMDIFAGDTITFLEDWSESGRSMVQQGVQTLDASIQEDWTPLAMAAPAGAVEGNGESLHFADPLYEQAYNDSAITVKAAVVANRDIAEDALAECIIVPLEVGGIKKPIAVIRTSEGDEYATWGGALMKRAAEGDSWTLVSALNDIDGLSSEYFSYTPARMVSEDERLPGGVYDEPTDEQTELEDAFMYTETDPPAASKVRNYSGGRTTFWYKGAWYDVAKLPEGSTALSEYEKYRKERR